jgi:hypothetical protein
VVRGGGEGMSIHSCKRTGRRRQSKITTPKRISHQKKSLRRPGRCNKYTLSPSLPVSTRSNVASASNAYVFTVVLVRRSRHSSLRDGGGRDAMPLALVALFDEQCTTCNSPRLMSGSTRYFPLGLKVAVILPDLKSSMDVSTIPDVDVGGRSDERDAALALFRIDRRSWALLIMMNGYSCFTCRRRRSNRGRGEAGWNEPRRTILDAKGKAST